MPTIEERLQVLEEQIDASKAENSTPPGGLVVLANGEIAYEFEGKITALGLSLPENLLPVTEPGPQSKVAWFDPAGVQREYIVGSFVGGQSLIDINAIAEGRTGAGVNVVAEMTSGGKVARLAVGVNEAEQNVTALAGGISKFILDNTGASSFLQLIFAKNRTAIFGAVSGAGAIVRGDGFTATRTGVGVYGIAFSGGALNSVPEVLATPSEFNRAIRISAETVNGFTVNIVSLAEVASDSKFNFIAIG